MRAYRRCLAGAGVCLVLTGTTAEVAQVEPATTTPYELKVAMAGLIAFTPLGTAPTGKPLDEGETPAMLALFPRASRPEFFDAVRIPDRLEFQPRKKHPAHHVVLKLKAKNLDYVSNGMEWIRVPLPPLNEDGQYQIGFEGLPASSGTVKYERFGEVEPVIGGESAAWEYIPLSRKVPGDISRLSAMVTFGAGWTLGSTAAVTGPMVRVPCWEAMSVRHCGKTERAKKPTPPRFSVQVEAVRGGLTAPFTLSVTKKTAHGTTTLLSIPLKRYRNEPSVDVGIVHIPFDEFFEENHGMREFAHFNLYRLLGDSIEDPYFFPHRGEPGAVEVAHDSVGARLPSVEATATGIGILGGDPFCTPLAQFVY